VPGHAPGRYRVGAVAGNREQRTLQDLFLDYALYAPFGLALTIAEELPQLAEKGRLRLNNQVQMARVVGKFTADEAQRRISRLAAQRSGQPAKQAPSQPAGAHQSTEVEGVVRANGSAPAVAASDSALSGRAARHGSEHESNGRPVTPSPAGLTPSAASAPPPTKARNRGGRSAGAPVARATTAAAPREPGEPSAPLAAELPIPGYDTLAASQVVQRLSSLRPDELEAVRQYEAATRGRRTILHRVAQLAAGPATGPAVAGHQP
jgi:hypothetical protein